MSITRTFHTSARAIDMYRTFGPRCVKRLHQPGSPVERDLLSISDTVQISREALDRLELLRQEQEQAAMEEASARQAEDYELEESLKMLEIDKNASMEEIREAYLHAIQRYHPDKHAHLPPEFRNLAEIKTKQINEWYSSLLQRKVGGSGNY